jgi:hypothetical protein
MGSDWRGQFEEEGDDKVRSGCFNRWSIRPDSRLHHLDLSTIKGRLMDPTATIRSPSGGAGVGPDLPQTRVLVCHQNQKSLSSEHHRGSSQQ